MIGFDAPFARSRQEQGRRDLLARLRAVLRYAHGARHAEESGRGSSQALRDHEETHPDFVRLHFRSVAVFLFLLVVLVAVWWVDFLLFSSTAEYFAGRVFHSWLWLVPIVCFFSPAILLLIEIGIGLQRDLARDEGGFGSNVRVLGWTAIGVLLAFVVPLAAVAATLAAQPSVSDSDATAALRMQTAALAILAFAGHLLVLFGGRYAHESKAFAAFKLSQLSLRAKVRLCERRARVMAEAAISAFKDYYHQREIHNAEFPEAPVEAGPFDALTRDFINERFGYEFITITPIEKSSKRKLGKRRGRQENTRPEPSKNQGKQQPPGPQDLSPGSASLPSDDNAPSPRRRKPPQAA
jgi:hypothetical protein